MDCLFHDLGYALVELRVGHAFAAARLAACEAQHLHAQHGKIGCLVLVFLRN